MRPSKAPLCTALRLQAYLGIFQNQVTSLRVPRIRIIVTIISVHVYIYIYLYIHVLESILGSAYLDKLPLLLGYSIKDPTLSVLSEIGIPPVVRSAHTSPPRCLLSRPAARGSNMK